MTIDEFTQGILRGAAINLITWIDYNAAEGNPCLSNMECKDIEDALVSGDWNKIYAYMKKKLEKQGEEKPIFNVVDWQPSKVDGKIHNIYNSEVEPKFHKFHEGDWVVYKNDICQIVKREEGCNKLVTVFGIEKELVNERNLSTARLWTIDDAKDGDVLYSLDSKQPFIYKDRLQFSQARGYCCINKFGEFAVWYTSKCVICTDKYIPATKEQRDFLFAKMKDAGYTFDFEKKELKKIRQKPKWSYEDSKVIDNCCLLIAAADDSYEKAFKDDCIHYLQNLKQRMGV